MGNHLDKVLIAPNRRDVPWYHGWFALFRIPNLFTVPGDQLAGYCLAGGLAGGRPLGLLCAIGAGLCLYAAGLAINDLVDAHEDLSERPWRPLATGLLNRAHVEWMVVLLLAVALALGALDGVMMLSLVAMLVAAILAYNALLKTVPLAGELLMGSCRAMSLLLGSVAAVERLPFPNLAILGAGISLSYIVSVALVARFETRPDRTTWIRWAPALVCFGWTLIPPTMPDVFIRSQPLYVIPYLIVGGVALRAACGIGRYLEPETGMKKRRKSTLHVSALVGAMIRSLILVQAMLVLIAEPSDFGLAIAAGVATLWLPSTWLGRSIPSS